MTKIYRLIIFLPFVILACAPTVIDENKLIQKIESLDMNIFSKKGEKIFLEAANSNYDPLELNLDEVIFQGKLLAVWRKV